VVQNQRERPPETTVFEVYRLMDGLVGKMSTIYDSKKENFVATVRMMMTLIKVRPKMLEKSINYCDIP
jgi:hypothetical protein